MVQSDLDQLSTSLIGIFFDMAQVSLRNLIFEQKYAR